MKTFRVYVTRTYVYDGIIDVEAFTPEQAEKVALGLIGDQELHIKDMVEGQDTAEVMREVSDNKEVI